MTLAHAHKRPLPDNDVPEEFEPGAPPVEPDEGPVPPAIPDDPEHDRVVHPDETPDLTARSGPTLFEGALCL